MGPAYAVRRDRSIPAVLSWVVRPASAPAASALIGLYRRHLSPRKGFRCAHAALHGGPSCSHAIEAIVNERGLLGGRAAIRTRFEACRAAAATLRAAGLSSVGASNGGSGRPSRGRRARRAACEVLDCAGEVGDCPCDACPSWP